MAQSHELLGKRFLLADDAYINRMMVERTISRFGGSCLAVHDGQEAFEQFLISTPGEYAAILMDLQMPRMDGLAATQAIRASAHPDAAVIPILALTSLSAPETVQLCLRCGVTRHMAKPFNPQALLQAILELTA